MQDKDKLICPYVKCKRDTHNCLCVVCNSQHILCKTCIWCKKEKNDKVKKSVQVYLGKWNRI